MFEQLIQYFLRLSQIIQMPKSYSQSLKSFMCGIFKESAAMDGSFWSPFFALEPFPSDAPLFRF